ncbi:glucose-6-phosphate/phosphate-tranlocation protein, putative [Trichomonas vaginalis G3]|uniref:Glucose-6-phosphate/phosphate-tranlocation protein, putative n=1 Tax=Trichomonas vaginalis (strain ATCC PRA-98 / G3) TaxID=412133 RepID=A2DQT9_TRIV3|nr:carbohydrate transport [Trichomonas vaginalis G3]EAY17206.1 glucose-6-phosphate/phosphate-tranlocation protein, putative [Trichomonas vaginalis G3]KAI5486261.1 carbohydrate transport [Trichomonas vaginalis G3]|eukprot:XP_001329429.1 glucose-6-phosphate/phosphate-tranlocation protein [Trichomonas vaginalis G3]
MGCGTPFLIGGSMATSTTLIMLNKHVMQNYGFRWPISLSTFHFFCTWGVLELLCRLKFFERATAMPLKMRITCAFESVAGIIFANFSLKLNSVGFYQLTKLLCIPAMVATNYFYYHKKTPFRTLCTLGVLLLGVALFTVNEVSVNLNGSIVSAIYIFFNVIFQIQTNVISNTYHISGPSYQLANSLPMTIISFFCAVFYEFFGDNSILKHEFKGPELFWTFMTGMIAVWANVFGISIIGKASPVTFQVVGHAKTILIFVFGLIFLDKNVEETADQKFKKICGLTLGMIGTIAYSIFEMQDKAKAKQEEARKANNQIEASPDDLELSEKFANADDDAVEVPDEEEEKKEN